MTIEARLILQLRGASKALPLNQPTGPASRLLSRAQAAKPSQSSTSKFQFQSVKCQRRIGRKRGVRGLVPQVVRHMGEECALRL
jgi:hypothetical protein